MEKIDLEELKRLKAEGRLIFPQASDRAYIREGKTITCHVNNDYLGSLSYVVTDDHLDVGKDVLFTLKFESDQLADYFGEDLYYGEYDGA